jgi:hypothetical protein
MQFVFGQGRGCGAVWWLVWWGAAFFFRLNWDSWDYWIIGLNTNFFESRICI